MRRSFTLSEVLITLMIIGVVSAVTVPALQQNVSKKTQVTQVKKTYNTLSEAIKLFMYDNDVDDLSDIDAAQLASFVTNYFQIAKDCGVYHISENNACFADSYKAIKGSSTKSYSVGVAPVTKNEQQCSCGSILISGSVCADGSVAVCVTNSIELPGSTAECVRAVTLTDGTAMCVSLDNNRSVNIQIDINGTEAPNVSGRDFFSMDIDSRGRVYDSNCQNTNCCPASVTSAEPMGIGKLIYSDWKMTY